MSSMRAELARKRQIRENACRLSIDTIGKHKLWVKPDCDRPRYDDLLGRLHLRHALARQEGLQAEGTDLLHTRAAA